MRRHITRTCNYYAQSVLDLCFYSGVASFKAAGAAVYLDKLWGYVPARYRMSTLTVTNSPSSNHPIRSFGGMGIGGWLSRDLAINIVERIWSRGFLVLEYNSNLSIIAGSGKCVWYEVKYDVDEFSSYIRICYSAPILLIIILVYYLGVIKIDIWSTPLVSCQERSITTQISFCPSTDRSKAEL